MPIASTRSIRAFKAAQDVTLERLYLETMEEVLRNSNKVIIDKSAEGGTGVLPYLPLPALGGGNPPGNAPAQGARREHRRQPSARGNHRQRLPSRPPRPAMRR